MGRCCWLLCGSRADREVGPAPVGPGRACRCGRFADRAISRPPRGFQGAPRRCLSPAEPLDSGHRPRAKSPQIRCLPCSSAIPSGLRTRLLATITRLSTRAPWICWTRRTSRPPHRFHALLDAWDPDLVHRHRPAMTGSPRVAIGRSREPHTTPDLDRIRSEPIPHPPRWAMCCNSRRDWPWSHPVSILSVSPPSASSADSTESTTPGDTTHRELALGPPSRTLPQISTP